MANAMLDDEQYVRASQADLSAFSSSISFSDNSENNQPLEQSISKQQQQQQEQQQQKPLIKSGSHVERINQLLQQHHNQEEEGDRTNNGPPLLPTTSTSSLSPGISMKTKSMTTRKSVDFALLPPSPKRSKYNNNSNSKQQHQSPQERQDESGSPQPVPYYDPQQMQDSQSVTSNTNDCCWSARQVVDAISTCISSSERMEAIQNAIESMNHSNQELHNEEMSTGIDAATTKHLTFLVYHYNIQKQQLQQHRQYNKTNSVGINEDEDDYQKEIGLTLEAMELLYRASSDIVGVSFRRMGNPLLHVLVSLVEDEIHHRVQIIQTHNYQTQICSQSTSASSSPLVTSENMKKVGDEAKVIVADNKKIILNPLLPPPQLGNIMVVTKPMSSAEPVSGCSSNIINSNQQQHQQNYSAGSIEIDNISMNSIPADLISLCNTLNGDLLLLKATKVIAHLARVGNATKTIAHYPSLLGNLVNLISVRPYECIPWEARLSALWTIANLACNPENMTMMVCTPNLVASLINVASRQLMMNSIIAAANMNNHDLATVPSCLETTMEILRSRSIASRAILNLSWAPENKIILSEQSALVDLLCDLTVTRNALTAATSATMTNASEGGSKYVSMYNKSRTVQDILVTTRRHAVGALRNMAAAPRRIKIQLCNHRNGRLLQALTDAALNDLDYAVQERVYGTIHNLANQDTAEKIISNPALVMALKDVLLSSSNLTGSENEFEGIDNTYGSNIGYEYHTGHNDSQLQHHQPQLSLIRPDGVLQKHNSPKEHAASTLTILERSITPDMVDSFEILRELLHAVHPVQNSESGNGGDDDDDDDNDKSNNDRNYGRYNSNPYVTKSCTTADKDVNRNKDEPLEHQDFAAV